MDDITLSVTELHAYINQTLEFAYPVVTVLGEVSSYKVNQGKWVFFDIKDDETTLGCFMPLYQLKTALQDGMMVRAHVSPSITRWGKFSLTVRGIELAGDGTAKKAFELMKARFEAEGLFASERKRSLPTYPQKVCLITSKQAAAYNDFLSIIHDRWAGLEIDQAQVQVQGLEAPSQIVRAVQYFNSCGKDYDAMVIIRGGGSPDDLQAFNHEDVVRAIYGSKIPTIVGIGHEDDISLAELVADLRAATPTDAARRLTPDKLEVHDRLNKQIASLASDVLGRSRQSRSKLDHMEFLFVRHLQRAKTRIDGLFAGLSSTVLIALERSRGELQSLLNTLDALDPSAVLQRGYSIVSLGGKIINSSHDVPVGTQIMVQLHKGTITAERVGDDSKTN